MFHKKLYIFIFYYAKVTKVKLHVQKQFHELTATQKCTSNGPYCLRTLKFTNEADAVQNELTD
jgi:hypothetical protein